MIVTVEIRSSLPTYSTVVHCHTLDQCMVGCHHKSLYISDYILIAGLEIVKKDGQLVHAIYTTFFSSPEP